MTQTISSQTSRPLSPHLQIYRWSVTMALSILHRATGVALVAGAALLAFWLWAAAYDAACFNAIHAFFGGWPGRILLIGWTASFYLHLCNGVRHLFWDVGLGFEIADAKRSGWIVVSVTAAMTLITWFTLLHGGAQ